MEKPIVNISELEFKSSPVPPANPDKFAGTMGQIGMPLGMKLIGANVTVVPAGKRMFPFHSHRMNEEFFYIIEGEGTLRLGTEQYPVKQGDFIYCPPGGPETAHQIVNTGTAELKYLAISSKHSPEIADYPDSGKFGVLAGNFRFVGKADQSLGYWEGES